MIIYFVPSGAYAFYVVLAPLFGIFPTAPIPPYIVLYIIYPPLFRADLLILKGFYPFTPPSLPFSPPGGPPVGPPLLDTILPPIIPRALEFLLCLAYCKADD